MEDPVDDDVLLKELYPDLSEEELLTAKENLGRYLLLAWEISSSVVAEQPVDISLSRSTMKERSNSNLKD